MGQIRLGMLPATKKWKRVVALLAYGAPNREPERAPKLRRTRWNTRGVIPPSSALLASNTDSACSPVVRFSGQFAATRIERRRQPTTGADQLVSGGGEAMQALKWVEDEARRFRNCR